MSRESLVARAKREEWPTLAPYQKYYGHLIYCNGDRRKPIGHPGGICICLRELQNTANPEGDSK